MKGPSIRLDMSIRSLEKAFLRSKPGFQAQLKMIPVPSIGHRLVDGVLNSCIKASVLILFYPWEDRLHLVLTRRTERVSRHQAQISFPGGRCEHKESFKQTALRETQEEMGVIPDDVRILGDLTPLYIPPSNYCIYPIVGITASRPEFVPSAKEVAEVIEVPLDHLLDSQNIKKENWTIREESFLVPFYFYGGHKIWGATAMVLAELIEMIERCES
jgi:8-oxo-dGTP pyrophosphatase MutT (NUDIX family)